MMKRLFTLLTLTMGVSACSSMTSDFSDATKDMNFMDRDDIAQLRGTEDIDEVRYTGYNTTKSIKTLGAISINNFDDVTGKNDPTVINLKRSKSMFYAETQLFESDNKEKSFFDETYLNIGLDKKAKGLSFELSLKF